MRRGGRNDEHEGITVTKNQTFHSITTDCASYRFTFYRNTKEKLCRSVASRRLFLRMVDELIRMNKIIS